MMPQEGNAEDLSSDEALLSAGSFVESYVTYLPSAVVLDWNFSIIVNPHFPNHHIVNAECCSVPRKMVSKLGDFQMDCSIAHDLQWVQTWRKMVALD
jgi:hypothetical protein